MEDRKGEVVLRCLHFITQLPNKMNRLAVPLLLVVLSTATAVADYPVLSKLTIEPGSPILVLAIAVVLHDLHQGRVFCRVDKFNANPSISQLNGLNAESP